MIAFLIYIHIFFFSSMHETFYLISTHSFVFERDEVDFALVTFDLAFVRAPWLIAAEVGILHFCMQDNEWIRLFFFSPF